MARCPIVTPQTVRIALSQEDWVEVKKELNAGEYRDMLIAQFKDAPPAGEQPRLDLQQVGLSLMQSYVVGWSFVDLDGRPLLVAPDVFRKLDQETFVEVRQAVEAHHETSELERTARKNAPAGERASSTISPLPS